MGKRLKQNRNLHEYTAAAFNGSRCYEKQPLISEYLDIIHNVINRSVAEHPRTLAIRVDLRYPRYCQPTWGNEVMARFFEKVTYLLNKDYQERLSRGVNAYRTSLRYVWCRESTEQSPCHYHLMLFVNRDAYYRLGDFNDLQQGLAGMIRRAWAYALQLECHVNNGSVEFPPNPVYELNANSPDYEKQFNDAFYRASYFAKAKTKVWGDRTRSFGSSRK